jgi:hypothetical protein
MTLTAATSGENGSQCEPVNVRGHYWFRFKGTGVARVNEF